MEKYVELIELQKVWLKAKGSSLFADSLRKPLPFSYFEIEEAVELFAQQEGRRVDKWELILQERIIPRSSIPCVRGVKIWLV